MAQKADYSFLPLSESRGSYETFPKMQLPLIHMEKIERFQTPKITCQITPNMRNCIRFMLSVTPLQALRP